jgi:hypothetical protein
MTTMLLCYSVWRSDLKEQAPDGHIQAIAAPAASSRPHDGIFLAHTLMPGVGASLGLIQGVQSDIE